MKSYSETSSLFVSLEAVSLFLLPPGKRLNNELTIHKIKNEEINPRQNPLAIPNGLKILLFRSCFSFLVICFSRLLFSTP